jgi:hypothetical protein
MRLTVLERIVLLGVLPGEGNFITLKIVRQLREALSFTEEELKDLSLQQVGEQVTWNAAAADPEGTEISIGEKATDLIVESLKKLNEENKLTQQHFSLYEKFVEK